jgi:uncharacterized protein (DUF58 family)
MTASRRLYVLLILAMVPFALSGIWSPAKVVGLVYDVAVFALLLADYLLTQRPHLISASRHVAERLSIGRDNDVRLDIVNAGENRLHCRVRDDHPATIDVDVKEFDFTLEPTSKAELKYLLIPKERGAFYFGNINIRYRSFLGYFWREVKVPATQKVRVFSDLKALHELSIKLSHSSELGELHQRKRGQGTDFASLREYTSGDDTRAIDWKATARRDRPVVRTYETDQEQVMLILIDAGRMMFSDLEGLSRFDHALNAGLCLALAGLTRNDQVGIGIFADKPLLFLPPRRGKAQLKRFLEALFDVRPRMVEPDYTGVLAYYASVQKARSLMVVITDLTDPMGSQTLLTGLASLSPRHLPFCVTLRDRQVDRIAGDRTLKVENIYQRAVATDLLTQRDLALSVLVRKGCMVLDSPPQELSEQLVDRYLQIKMRGRL